MNLEGEPIDAVGHQGPFVAAIDAASRQVVRDIARDVVGLGACEAPEPQAEAATLIFPHTPARGRCSINQRGLKSSFSSIAKGGLLSSGDQTTRSRWISGSPASGVQTSTNSSSPFTIQ